MSTKPLKKIELKLNYKVNLFWKDIYVVRILLLSNNKINIEKNGPSIKQIYFYRKKILKTIKRLNL